jgi:hypothetical protein
MLDNVSNTLPVGGLTDVCGSCRMQGMHLSYVCGGARLFNH